MEKEKISPLWQILILLLSVYVLIALLAEILLKLPKETLIILFYANNIACIFFLFDFFYNLVTSKEKWGKYLLTWGWIDFLSSIPYVPYLQIGRFFRIFRLLRAIRSTRLIIKTVFNMCGKKANLTLISVGLISLVLVIFSSIAILNFEDNPNSNIKEYSDSLWYSLGTITTVGFGDKYPVTTEGRIIAIMLMISGVGLCSIFTAYVSAHFISTDEKKIDHETQILNKLEAIEKELKELKIHTIENYKIHK